MTLLSSGIPVKLFDVRRMPDAVVVDVTGAVDSLNFATLLQRLDADGDVADAGFLVLNLERLGYVQSSAWQRLVAFAKTARQEGTHIGVCRPPQGLLATLASHPDCEALAVFADENEAFEAGRPARRPACDPAEADGKAAGREPQPPAARAAPPATPAMPAPADPPVAMIASPASEVRTRAARLPSWVFAIGELFREKPVAATGLAAGLIVLCSLPMLLRSPDETRVVENCERYFAEYRELKRRKASASEWSDVRLRASADLTPAVRRLSARGGSRTPMQTTLLATVKELLELLNESDSSDAARHERSLRERLHSLQTP